MGGFSHILQNLLSAGNAAHAVLTASYPYMNPTLCTLMKPGYYQNMKDT